MSYGIAVRLRDSGSDDETIASALDIQVAEVVSLLEAAEAQLAELVASD